MLGEYPEDMKLWVNEDSLKRDVTIRGHVHGVRVTLSEGAVEVTAVRETILKAFQDCLFELPAARRQHLTEKIARIQSQLNNLENQREKAQYELEEARREFKSI